MGVVRHAIRTRDDVIKEAEQLGVELVSKEHATWAKVLGTFFGSQWVEYWWNTYRLPFSKTVKIYYPTIGDPDTDWGIIDHELVHAADLKPWWGPWLYVLGASLLPLPVLFSGRWFIERRAYLRDIQQGRRTIENAVDTLWWNYGFCWPRSLMRRWFERHA